MEKQSARELVTLLPNKMVLFWPDGHHDIVGVNADLNHRYWMYVNYRHGGQPEVVKAT